MTKAIGKPELTIEQLFDNLQLSPYYDIAWKYMDKKGVKDPCVLDMILAFHEIAVIDNKLNKRNKKNG